MTELTLVRPRVDIRCHEGWSWMSVEDILKLEPTNFLGKTWDWHYGNCREDEWYLDLKERLLDDGFTCPVVVNMGSGRIGNGHHRITIAVEVGWAEIPVMVEECYCGCGDYCPEPGWNGGWTATAQ